MVGDAQLHGVGLGVGASVGDADGNGIGVGVPTGLGDGDGDGVTTGGIGVGQAATTTFEVMFIGEDKHIDIYVPGLSSVSVSGTGLPSHGHT